MAKTLEQVADSIEAVHETLKALTAEQLVEIQELLKANRSMGNALLLRRVQDLETALRKLSQGHACPCQYVLACQEANKALGQRIELAGVKFVEMRRELDAMKGVATNGEAVAR